MQDTEFKNSHNYSIKATNFEDKNFEDLRKNVGSLSKGITQMGICLGNSRNIEEVIFSKCSLSFVMISLVHNLSY